MSKMIIVEGNSSDKDNVRAIMVKGEKGYSAYEIAVQNGYTGTEEEWADSFLNADNYYNKSEIDNSQSTQDETINAINNNLNDNYYTKSAIEEIKETQDTAISNLETQKANQEDLEVTNNTLENLSSTVTGLASGSPIPVSSTSEMTDTSRIYVNTTNGNWYYYNGSSWVSGGTYQSSGIADESITINKLSSELESKHLFEYDWVLGSVGNTQGTLTNSTTRIRFFKKIWLEKGTIIKFTNSQSNTLQWNFQSWPTVSNLPITENSGWLTTATYQISYSGYYCLVVRYTDNRTIQPEEVNDLSTCITIYRPTFNRANKMLNWYSVANPFSFEENVTDEENDTVKNIIFNGNGINYWLMFENFIEYYNNVWGTTNKTINRIITYNLENYGNVTTNSQGRKILNVQIPSNYALVLNVITGVMSVKPYSDMSETEGLLIRNANGYVVAGAFKEIYDYWINKSMKDKVDALEVSSSMNFDINVKGVAHRGYSSVAPENTLPAYKLAKKNGFNYVECDVSFTSDGIPVLLHDSTIDRTSNGTGSINSLTFEYVRTLDFGSWKSSQYANTQIPSFEEFILLCKNLGLHPYIELKDTATYTESQIQGLVDIVNSFGMKNKVTWISFSSTYLTYVKNYDSEARLGYVASTISSTTITTATGLITDDNEVFIDANYSNLTDETVGLCVDDNIPLEVWTVNSTASILNLNSYISGVTSNYLIAGKVLYDNNIS